MNGQNTSNTPTGTPSIQDGVRTFIADQFLPPKPAPDAGQGTAPASEGQAVPQPPSQDAPPDTGVTALPTDSANGGLAEGNQTPTAEPPPAVPSSTDAPPDGFDFSFGLPDNPDDDDKPSIDPQVMQRLTELAHVDDSTPVVHREALERLAADGELSQEDKELIAQSNPSRWEMLRRRTKNADIITKFRRQDYPMQEFANHLEKQSGTRSVELKDYYLTEAVQSSEALTAFAGSHPDLYKSLMVGLATASPDSVKAILEAQGYWVEKADALPDTSVDSILAKLKEKHDGDYSLIAGSELEQDVKALLEKAVSENAAMKLKTENAQSTPAPVTAPAQETDAQFEVKRDLYQSVMGAWEQDFDRSLEAAGLRPSTPDEYRQNFKAATLRDTAYTIAKYGYGNKAEPWLSQFLKWSEKQSAFEDINTGVTSAIEEAKRDEAMSYARSAAGLVFDFGSLRAKMPAVVTYLTMAKEAEKGISSAPAGVGGQQQQTSNGATVVDSGVPPPDPGTQANGQQKREYLSDKLYLKNIGN